VRMLFKRNVPITACFDSQSNGAARQREPFIFAVEAPFFTAGSCRGLPTHIATRGSVLLCVRMKS